MTQHDNTNNVRHPALGRDFWKVWGSTAASGLSDTVAFVGTALLAASLTRDATLIAAVAVAGRTPWLLFSLHAGALVDRLDRRWILLAMNLLRVFVLASASVAVYFGWMSIYLLMGCAFLLGTAEVLYENAAQSILPRVVPKEKLPLANSRLQLAQLLGGFAGPPLGGFLFAASAAVPFGLSSVGLAVSAILVFLLARHYETSQGAGQRTSINAAITEGLRWLARHPLLRGLAVMVAVINLMNMATGAVFVLFALEKLGLSQAEFGALLTFGTAGGLLGALASGYVLQHVSSRVALLLVVALQALSYAIIALFPIPWVVGSLFGLLSFTGVIWNIVTVSLRQMLVPDQLLGRVNSSYRLLAWGVNPFGAALGGLVAHTYGLTGPYWLAAGGLGVVLAFGMVLLREPIPVTKTLNYGVPRSDQ